MDYKKDKNCENIDENIKPNKSFILSITDSIVNAINMLMDTGVILLNLLFYIYKFIAKHTFLISVIIVIFGYVYLIS